MLSLDSLPDELLLQVLYFLDVPDLLITSRTSQHLRDLSLDPRLHRLRLKGSCERVNHLLPKRPILHSLRPPNATIYLTQTHVTARRLHWSLVRIRLARLLSRRPKLSALVSANILPKECCKIDRRSGDFVWGYGVAGPLVERKRKIERERLKEGLRVWLERKAQQIPARRREGGVGVLVWRFSKRLKLGSVVEERLVIEKPKKDQVSGLKRFWEGLSGS